MLPYRLLRCHANLVPKTSALRSYSTLKECNVVSPNAILYGDEASPPVRFVLMTAAVLGVKMDFQRVDLFLGLNKSQFYKKINPLQKVPALCISKQVIVDSHAIALSLCRARGSTELYPADSTARARVDQLLFFNASELFPVDSAILSKFFAGSWPVEEAMVDRWYFLLDYLDSMLSESKWLAGDEMTLADLCCAATVSSMQLLFPPLDHHHRLNHWMSELNSLPCFEINRNGLERLKGFVNEMNNFYDTNKVC